MKNKTYTLTKTAILLALLIVLQIVTKPLSQTVTGSAVNLILAVSAMFLPLPYCLLIAIVSPVLAFIIGVGPQFLMIVPCISIGNAIYVVSINYLNSKLNSNSKMFKRELMIIVASLLKFIFLFVSVVLIVVPILNLPEAKVKVLSTMFSFPQFINAIIGGCIALIIDRYDNVKVSK